MFRELTRKKQRLSDAVCIELLKTELRGVLSVLGDDGYPYGLPIDHWYCEKNGKLYFHSGRTGHKADALARCDKASFCVYDRGYRSEGEWALHIKSVIAFGRVRPVTDYELAMDAVRALSQKFTDDTAYIERDIEKNGRATLVYEMTIEHLCGKLVNES